MEQPPSKKFKTVPSEKADWKSPDWYRAAKDTVGHLVAEIPIGEFKMNLNLV